MTTKSMLISRPAIVPVWLFVFGLIVMSGSPMAAATGILLLLVMGMVLTGMLVLWTERPTMTPMTTPRY